MINNLSTNFLLAMDDDSRAPIQLLVFHFAAGDIYLSDRDITINGKLYTGIVENWGTLSTVGSENAVSSTMELDLTLWDGGESFSNNFLYEDPVDVFVDVYQTFEGLSEADFAHIGEFVIQEPIEHSEASRLLDLTLVTTNMRYFAQVGELLTREKYPNALASDINKSIDLIVGDAGSVKCLCSKKPPFATVTGSFLKRATKIYTHEDLVEKGFTQSGYIQIDDEIMQYESLTSEYFDVITRGIFGTVNVDHSDGSEITQANSDSEYIVGQSPLTSINNVKINGQEPTISYTTHNINGVALIRFPTQPTYFEYSKGARSLDENFDAPASDNTAYRPDWAYNTKNKSLGSIIEASTPILSIIQNDAPIDEGEIVKLFLNIEHWATKAYANDRVDVFVEGINNNKAIGFLNRPNHQDVFDLGGEVDLDHGHGHYTGGNHTHDNQDPDFNSTSEAHLHDLDGSELGTEGTIQTQENILNVDCVRYTNYDFAPYNANTTRVAVKFIITGVGWGDWDFRYAWIEVGDTRFPVANNQNIILTAWTTSKTRIRVRACNAGGGTAKLTFKFLSVTVFTSASVTSNTLSPVSTSKTFSGSVNGLQQNTSVIKDSNDVVDLNTANQDLIITLKENSSRSIVQKFDITSYLEKIDWSWIVGRKVSLKFINSNTAETPEIVITYINFEIEYRQRQVKSTDNISCDVIGSIDNRPDAVVEYLLTQKAGLPIERLGSVYRDIPKWDDSEFWDDLDVWIDEGQVSGAIPGAAFEEASAWFDFHEYTIDGVLPGNITVKDAIAKLAFQTRSKLTWQNGYAKLSILRKSENWLIAKNIPTNDIQLKSYTAKKSEISKVINKIDLFHSIDRLADAIDSGQYEKTAYIHDQTSINKHGEKVDNVKWLFDLIRNQPMAESLADYYLWEFGEPSTYYTFRTYLKHFDLEKEDYATINSFKFAKLKQLPIAIKEIQRDFGSGKLSKINTLMMVCQSIRHLLHNVIVDDIVYANDSLDIDFGLISEFSDVVSFTDFIDFNWGKDFEDSITISEVFNIIAVFKEKIEDVISITSEIIADIQINIDDSVTINDEFSVTQELCWGACGFGCPDGIGVKFGSKTIHKDFPFESLNTSDELGIGIGVNIDDIQEVSDNLVFSDGFGCPSGLGDGFGLSPFGC